MRQVRTTVLAVLLAAGCGTTGGSDTRTDDIDAADLFAGVVAIYCDGEASSFD